MGGRPLYTVPKRKFWKKMAPWDPPGVLRVPISGPAHGMFSKINGPGLLGSRGHSHTSCGSGKFHGSQSSFHISVNLLSSMFNPKIKCRMPFSGSQWAIQLCKKLPTSGYSTWWRFWRSFLLMFTVRAHSTYILWSTFCFFHSWPHSDFICHWQKTRNLQKNS